MRESISEPLEIQTGNFDSSISVRLLMARLAAGLPISTGRPISWLTRGTDLRTSRTASDIVDVFCFADSPLEFLEAERFSASTRYRFWTCSTRLLNLLTGYFGLPRASFGYVDRYHLFPRSNFAIGLEETDSFVFAQRDVFAKNLDLGFELAFALKRSAPFKKHLVFLCGSQKPSRPTPEGVIHLGDLGVHWYRDSRLRSSAFINLSTSHFEDFGISVAQAQAAGMPVVLSDWFGHKDVAGDDVYFLPASIIIRARHQKEPGRLLRRFLVRGRQRRSVPLVVPRPIAGSEIHRIGRKLSSLKRARLSLFFEGMSSIPCRASAEPVIARYLGCKSES